LKTVFSGTPARHGDVGHPDRVEAVVVIARARVINLMRRKMLSMQGWAAIFTP
jgi:hypothetical protein